MKIQVLILIFAMIMGGFIGAFFTNLNLKNKEQKIEYLESKPIDSLIINDTNSSERFEDDSLNYSEELFSDLEKPLKITPFPYIEVNLACFPPKNHRLYKHTRHFKAPIKHYEAE